MELPGLGAAAQEKLLASRVLVLGLAGTGSAAARYLAGAGIGTLGILDCLSVSVGELHAEILSTAADQGAKRTAAAERHLGQLNGDVRIVCHEEALTAHNAEELFRQYDLIIDGLDDWQGKLVASDACMLVGKPLIHAGVSKYRFQVFTMVPGRSACLRCVFHQIGMEDLSRPDAPAGLHGPAVGMAGALQASEAIHLLARLGITGADELIQFDCLRREFDCVRELKPRPDCPDCSIR